MGLFHTTTTNTLSKTKMLEMLSSCIKTDGVSIYPYSQEIWFYGSDEGRKALKKINALLTYLNLEFKTENDIIVKKKKSNKQ